MVKSCSPGLFTIKYFYNLIRELYFQSLIIMNSINKIIILLILGTLVISCNESLVDNPVGNKSPDTYISLFPDSSIAQQRSRLKVSWWGDDPDGLIVGYYFKWEGIDSSWTFTTRTDSLFSLPIGTSDTTYNFLVSAVDNSGNGTYDDQVVQNNINYGPEPFVDANGNGKYDSGEKFYDIGVIDPTPASLNFPIKNSPPEVAWNPLTVIPDTSFPVMTFAWNTDDLDGAETIVNINISLNDTTNFVALDGNVNLVTLVPVDLNSSTPEMKILINGSESNPLTERLQGIVLNDTNRIYIQAKDLSGAYSKMISLPDSGHTWYVKKPNGNLLIVDDFPTINNQITSFYNNAFNTINGGALAGKFEVYDFQKTPLPFQNVTFPQTIKLFKYLYWYSNSTPHLSLLSLVTNNFIDPNGHNGKIMFSMTFADSSADFAVDAPTLRLFLPIDSLGQRRSIPFVFAPADIVPVSPENQYPALRTTETLGSVRTFYSASTSQTVYNIVGNGPTGLHVDGPIAFINNDKRLFFIGVPLHIANGGRYEC